MAHKAPSRHPLAHTSRSRLVLLIALLLLAYAVVPQVGGFSASIRILLQANRVYVLTATILVAVTFVCAAGIYWCLAVRRLRFGRTLLVQLAGGFTNRLLPAGLGGLTLNVQYLRRSHHTLAQALAVSGTNNLLGWLGHGVLLAVSLLFFGAWPSDLHWRTLPPLGFIVLGTAFVLIIGGLAFRRARRYMYQLTATVFHQLAAYRHRPGQLLAAFACSLVLTSTYALVLWSSARAVGLAMGVAEIFIVFSVGLVAATATPTPGGLVGAEAGLSAALVAYGADATHAIAVALLYRLLTYWLPMLPGFVLFLRVRAVYL